MHSQGSSSWFSDGREERELILKMGEPWGNIGVIEIGCGEGELAIEIAKRVKAGVMAIDYSDEAIRKAIERGGPPNLVYRCGPYKGLHEETDRLVLQGILEHLDHPFIELKWMMENLLGEHGDVITSSPCFVNPRGIVWMTLDMLGALMSKTDLHFLDPDQFAFFCSKNGYGLSWDHCDKDWASGMNMVLDLYKRIPLALQDGPVDLQALYYQQKEKIDKFIQWLDKQKKHIPVNYGATAVYKITK